MTADDRQVRPHTIYLVAALAVCLVLCLSLTICLVASPRPPRLSLPRVEATENAAAIGEDKIMAMVDAPLGTFTMELTQEEATSLLAYRLPGSPFLDPQVVFTDGKIYVSGIVNMGVPLKVMSVWTVTDGTGTPQVTLERASIGPFAMPSILLNSVSATINEMIVESGTGILPTAVTIRKSSIVIEVAKSPPTVP